MAKKNNSRKKEQTPSKRPYIKQTDVPAASLSDALRIPQAILDHYAGKATSPLYVAKALNIDAKGTQLVVLSGASIAFGLTEGGAQASSITVTDLARRILRPKEEGADANAKREAVLKPRIFQEFLSRYNGNAFPRNDIALNVLEDLGVPRNKTADVLDRILESARAVGFLEEVKGRQYVVLNGSGPHVMQETPGDGEHDDSDAEDEQDEPQRSRSEAKSNISAAQPPPRPTSEMATAIIDDQRRKRVFITHGKNRGLVDPIKKLLDYGELEPVVSVEIQTVSKPVPEKVMGDMRSCGAAIIHVDNERTIIDAEGNQHDILNPNVLIEIGAAMAFYGKRFILLVQNGTTLPSNLQGLFEVRYDGETLDANSTIRLLEAIKDMKNHPLPSDVKGE